VLFCLKSGSLAPETYSLTDKRSVKIGHLSGFSKGAAEGESPGCSEYFGEEK
jgi:hypothetical protein